MQREEYKRVSESIRLDVEKNYGHKYYWLSR
jgi:hypothetical protein